MNPPLSRSFSLCVLNAAAIAILGCVFSGQNVAFAQQHVSAGPIQETHRLQLQFSGEKPQPLSMVSGDFDEDGVNDLVIGYGLQKGGSVTFLRGNLDAHAPQTHASWLAAGRHQYSNPYLQASKPTSVTAQPSLMISADVNGDGHLDLVYATKESTQLNVMFGDGKGNFLAPITTTVAGGITALAAYRPGQPLMGEAVVAGYQSRGGNGLSILTFTYGSKALTQQATYRMASPVTAMAVANLDADLVPDTAIVSGGKLLILHGNTALSGRGSMTTVPVEDAESVTTGEFLFDRHAQLQLSVLTTNGDVVTLAHAGFDSRPYTPQQIAETRRQQRGRAGANVQTLAEQAGNTGNEPWVEIQRNSGAAVHSTSDKAPILLRSRTMGSGGDDLVVLNSSQQQKTVISHSMAASSQSAFAAAPQPSQVTSSNLSSSNVVAAVSASVSTDARQGLVVLNADDPSPDITVPGTGNTFYVNTTADNTGSTTDPSDSVRCTEGSGEVCTLRDAITFANNDGAGNISAGNSDTIMVPSGAYSLTWQAGVTDSNTNALTHLEIYGPVTIIGSTAGGGTIINANNNDTIFSINPGIFGSYNPSGADGDSYVFDAALENLVLENGRNVNNLNINGGANYVGGGMNWDAFGTGNLTLTNTIIENNTVLWGPGGGIWAENSAGGGTGTLIINGGSISGNSTPELGGGIEEAFPPSALSVTNTTIAGNVAQISVNPSDTAGDGSGGGLFLEGRQPPPATPQSTLTGVTITSNIAANDDGGGILTFSGILLSGVTISNNTSGGSGGGVWSNPAGDGSQTTITSSNFLSNSAAGTGGAIALGLETQAEGNILQVSLSRIVGNTATGGGSGLANGVSGDGAGEAVATENWWGCNGGPTVTGCDQAVLIDSGGSLTTAPYAQLGFTSDVTTIPSGGSANLTVSMNTDSNGNSITGAFPAVATNYQYSFAVTGTTGSPAPPAGTFNTSGVGTAILTPTAGGSGTVTVTFDNQTDSINFTSQSTTPTSLSISAIPSTTFLYGQPSGFTVQLMPSNATGISSANFQVLVDGSSNVGGNPFGLILIGNNDYQIFGPFNLLPPGGHTLEVQFLGTTDYAGTQKSVPLNVLAGAVSLGSTVTPANPIKGQGGTVNVTVTGVGSGAVPTGMITYAFDGGTSQTIGLTGGAAAISVPLSLSTGNHSVSLAYSGDTNYATASTSTSLTIFGQSQTTIASLTPTTASINVLGFGFTAPSGQLTFTDTTSGTPVAAPVTLNTATAAPGLLPQVTTSTGVNSLPVWTELSDLNGDGILDLITSAFGTDSVNVQLGNGNGTFGAATSFLIAPGYGPAEVHAVSLRGNGTMDLIVGSFNVNRIAVLLGNGNGTFQPPIFYAVGSSANTPTSLTAGDFNLDGNLDVAVANTENNTVSILLGNGTGVLTTLGAPISVGHEPEAIRVGDFNNDGYSDLAVANYGDGTVTILLNNRDETFTASNITVGAGPQALDITGSGTNLLLAVANFLGNSVSVLQSNGNGTFAPQKVVLVGHGPDEVRFTDINGDGIPDLVVANYTDSTLTLVTGSAGGSYIALAPFPVGNNPYSAAVGDLNGDGTPDIVVANCFSDNTGTLLSGTQITVPYSGLGFVPGDNLDATYTPDGSSKYGSSTSTSVTAP